MYLIRELFLTSLNGFQLYFIAFKPAQLLMESTVCNHMFIFAYLLFSVSSTIFDLWEQALYAFLIENISSFWLSFLY